MRLASPAMADNCERIEASVVKCDYRLFSLWQLVAKCDLLDCDHQRETGHIMNHLVSYQQSSLIQLPWPDIPHP